MKTKEMKTVTLEQFMKFRPCWLYEDGGEERLRTIAKRKKNWSALDVLALEEVPANDRLWAVLREEFIDAPVLHEFACRCAEEALRFVDKPDPRSLAAIETKRRWLRGEATDEELAAAWSAAWCAAWSAAESAARCAAESAAESAAWSASWSASRSAARSAANEGHIKLLIDLIKEA